MMDTTIDIKRFYEPHRKYIEQALEEIRLGEKRTHWMWFIFPQIEGLGYSEMSTRYAIRSLDEAKAYWEDKVLGMHMQELCQTLLLSPVRDAKSIFGPVDAMKLRSSMTLFLLATGDSIFDRVLQKFFDGEQDELTLDILNDVKRVEQKN